MVPSLLGASWVSAILLVIILRVLVAQPLHLTLDINLVLQRDPACKVLLWVGVYRRLVEQQSDTK